MMTSIRSTGVLFGVMSAMLAACSGPAGTDAGSDVVTNDAVTEAGADVQGLDVIAPNDVMTTDDVPVGQDVVTGTDATPGCGNARPDITGIFGTEGLVIAADGTIYYSQSGAIGRMRPGMAQEDAWITLSGATTVWGLAIDAMHHVLYAGSPTTHRIYTVDLTAATPTATMLSFAAGGPNGLTTASDGSLFYSDFSGGYVWRVDSTGTRTRVTNTQIAQPNGLAFGPDGALYVDSYGDGTVLRVVLTANVESGFTTFASGLGSPDGLAFDSMGRLYVTDNAGGRLYQVAADGTGTPMRLLNGMRAPANVEFGTGALSCTDIYVATGNALMRYEMGTTTGAMVPWH